MAKDDKLKELIESAIAAHKALELAQQNLETARKEFGYAKLYSDEPRLINVDGEVWSVTVPFPSGSSYDDDVKWGTIRCEVVGKLI